MKKVPVTVVTGFLGAGKTSLIRHLIANADGRRLALVINEFGDIGVDGEILKSCGNETCTEDDIVELANGCICCTVADEVLPTLTKLLDRPEPPDHIVIETSGLALPKPLVKAFQWPEVRSRATVDGVVTVVDGPAVAAGLFAVDPDAIAAARALDPNVDHDAPLEELFADQLACADMIVVSKSDLLEAGEIDGILRTAQDGARDRVKTVVASYGRIPPAVLLGLDASAEDDIDQRWSHHDSEEDHDHDDFESFIVTLPAVASSDQLAARVKKALAADGVLRIKGIAAVQDRAARLVVQGVGERLETYFDRPWHADEEQVTKLVVIGLNGLARDHISDLMTN
jgi:cobalamin biosynthesis protein CobW